MKVCEPEDVRYVRENYFTLEELCDRAGLPRASYTLTDGTRFFPADYLDQRFSLEDFEAAGLRAADYEGFLAGTYGICMRLVTPLNIARKSVLIDSIGALIESPNEENEAWRENLRDAVEELDTLERPFTEFDRKFFGRPVSRDTYITQVRERYPAIFAPGCPITKRQPPVGA